MPLVYVLKFKHDKINTYINLLYSSWVLLIFLFFVALIIIRKWVIPKPESQNQKQNIALTAPKNLEWS